MLTRQRLTQPPSTITLQISANITGARRLLPLVASSPALTVGSSSRRLLSDPHTLPVNSEAAFRAPQIHFQLTNQCSHRRLWLCLSTCSSSRLLGRRLKELQVPLICIKDAAAASPPPRSSPNTRWFISSEVSPGRYVNIEMPPGGREVTPQGQLAQYMFDTGEESCGANGFGLTQQSCLHQGAE